MLRHCPGSAEGADKQIWHEEDDERNEKLGAGKDREMKTMNAASEEVSKKIRRNV